MVGIAKKDQVAWTHQSRMQLVKAVIRVEKEMMDKSNYDVNSRRGKWNRISELLPPKYRARTWNDEKQKFREPKCSRQFFILIYAYRDIVAGKDTRAARIVKLTKPLFKALKMREDQIRNARRRLAGEDSSPHSRSGNSITTDNCSKISQETEVSSSQSKEQSKEHSISSVGKEGPDRWDSEPTYELEGTDHQNTYSHRKFFGSVKVGREEWNHDGDNDDCIEDSDAAYSTLDPRHDEHDPIDSLQTKSTPSVPQNHVQSSEIRSQARLQIRAQTRKVVMAADSGAKGAPSMAQAKCCEDLHAMLGTRGPRGRLDGECHCQNCVPATRNFMSAQAGPRTRSQSGAKGKASSKYTRRNTGSRALAKFKCDVECLHTILDGSLRRLEEELSRLSSLLQNEINMIPAVRPPGKRHKANAEPAASYILSL